MTTYDGIVLKNTVTFKYLNKYTIPAGKLKLRNISKGFSYFLSENMTAENFGSPPIEAPGGGICQKVADPTFVRAFMPYGRCNISPQTPPEIEPTRIVEVNAPYFRQELLYNGRSGDTIRFLYREFAGDYARPPYSQDVQYDLKDGNTIGFKGARVEVLSASNTNLSYRVISSFPDPPN